MILRKIIQIVPQCQILRLKYTKFDFGRGSASAPDPAGGAYSAHPDLTGFKGPSSKRRGGERRQGEGREGEVVGA